MKSAPSSIGVIEDIEGSVRMEGMGEGKFAFFA